MFKLELIKSLNTFRGNERLTCPRIKIDVLKNDDTLIFIEIAKGNKAAFDTLFRKYYAQLVRFSIGYVHDGSISEELVQDVFVKIWENAPRLTITTSVLAYLYGSVRNHCLNFIKHEGIKKKYETEQVQKSNQETLDTTNEANMPRFKQLLTTAVNKLPDKCREIFEMAKFEGLSYDEISLYLEVSVKTVENQMGIALKKLRETMIPYANQIYEE